MSKTFEELLEAEKAALRPGVPYVIFRKTEYHAGSGGQREVAIEVPFVHYLDGCHGRVENVARWERRGWPIVEAGNLRDQDKERNEKLQAIAKHVETRKLYANQPAPSVVSQASGIQAKAEKKAAAKEVFNG